MIDLDPQEGRGFNPHKMPIHKFVEIIQRDEVALKSRPAINSGCSTLAAFLFLRLVCISHRRIVDLGDSQGEK
jgi:hypothetical protein